MAALIVACVAALVVTQRTRRSGLVVDRIELTSVFSPNGDGALDQAEIGFRVKRDELLKLDVTRDGRRIRRLADDEPVDDGEQLSYSWDGLADSGQLAPVGRYRIRIRLERDGRLIRPGEKMVLLGPEGEAGILP